MEDEKNNELIGKLRVMNKQELDKFIVRYRIHPNTLLACEEFIIKGARALVDIQRQLTRHYSNHVILNIIKSMPFYAPFHSMYCPEYNPYANIDELRSAVRHYDMFYANDSTAEELRDKINNAMSLNINTGAMFFKSKIKLYLRFIHFAQQNDVNIDSPKQYKNYTKISAILRLYYRTPSILDTKCMVNRLSL